jgi:2-methylcitrate dehydratase PrpD
MVMKSTATQSELLAGYAATITPDEVGQVALAKARSVVDDTVGVLIRSSQTSALRLLAEESASHGGKGEATVVGSSAKAPVEHAAFINGVGGHHIELDDSHGPSLTHPAAVMVPAALAVAEYAGASGQDVLMSLVVGYDVSARFSKAAGVQTIYSRGFHPSSVCGAIGAAATAGRLLKLDPWKMTMAISLAASQSSGLLTWEDDPAHLTKSFQTGIAARNGVQSALWAAAGYGGAVDSLAGRYNAIKAFGGDDADPSKLTYQMGSHFEILDTDFKRHSSCRHTHAAVDGLLDIVSEFDVKPDTISSIEVGLPHGSAYIVDGNPLWTHNIQFVLALAAHEGSVTYDHFTDEWTGNADIADLTSRVKVRGDDELEKAFPAAKGAILHVELTDGRTIDRKVPLPLGHRDHPIPDRALAEKFDILAGSFLDADRIARARELLGNLGGLANVDELMSVVAGR